MKPIPIYIDKYRGVWQLDVPYNGVAMTNEELRQRDFRLFTAGMVYQAHGLTNWKQVREIIAKEEEEYLKEKGLVA